MRAALAFAIVSTSLAAIACDGSPFPSSPSPSHPVVSIGVVTPASITASTFACPGAQLGVRDVTVFVTASRANLFLDTVTLRLGDGSNINGQSIPFPRAGLDAQFGSTLVRFGGSRSFALQPAFGCLSLPPRQIRADIIVVDEAGVRQSLTSTASLH